MKPRLCVDPLVRYRFGDEEDWRPMWKCSGQGIEGRGPTRELAFKCWRSNVAANAWLRNRMVVGPAAYASGGAGGRW